MKAALPDPAAGVLRNHFCQPSAGASRHRPFSFVLTRSFRFRRTGVACGSAAAFEGIRSPRPTGRAEMVSLRAGEVKALPVARRPEIPGRSGTTSACELRHQIPRCASRTCRTRDERGCESERSGFRTRTSSGARSDRHNCDPDCRGRPAGSGRPLRVPRVQQVGPGDYFASCLRANIEALRIFGGIHGLV